MHLRNNSPLRTTKDRRLNSTDINVKDQLSGHGGHLGCYGVKFKCILSALAVKWVISSSVSDDSLSLKEVLGERRQPRETYWLRRLMDWRMRPRYGGEGFMGREMYSG